MGMAASAPGAKVMARLDGLAVVCAWRVARELLRRRDGVARVRLGVRAGWHWTGQALTHSGGCAVLGPVWVGLCSFAELPEERCNRDVGDQGAFNPQR